MESKTKQLERRAKVSFGIEVGILLVLLISLLIYIAVFVKGQMNANRAIAEAAQILLEASQEKGSVSEEAHRAAMEYLQASQQAYSESNATNMLSIIYALVTAVILGYGARMLRLNDEIALKIQQSEAQLVEMKKNVTVTEGRITRRMVDISKKQERKFNKMQLDTEADFKIHNDVYIATTSCRNAAHTCTLLQSHLVLLEERDDEIPDIVWNLHVDFVRSLTEFCDFMKRYSNFTDKTSNALEHSWNLAKLSLRSYIGLNGRAALVEQFAPDDLELLKDIYENIESRFREIRKARRHVEQPV